MVEDDRYCIDILTQISAVSTALESLALQLLDEHVSTASRARWRPATQAEIGDEDERAAGGRAALREDALTP